MRRAYAEAWRKHLARVAARRRSKRMIADVIGAHPEYQALVADAEAAVGFEPRRRRCGESVFTYGAASRRARAGRRSTGRPESASCTGGCKRATAMHRAEHALMEALGETLWQAQRAGRPPDEGRYLALARRAHLDSDKG